MKRHSTSPSCGNLVDGLPHDCHTEPRWIDVTLAPRRFVIMVDILYVFGNLLYYKLLVCYIQMFYIILKFNFLWVTASELDETFVNNRAASSPKSWKNDEIFKLRWNFLLKTPGSGSSHLRSSPCGKFSGRIINEVICSTSFRRKPGWRFTAGSTYRARVNWRQPGPAKNYEFSHRFKVFSDILYCGY